ncbi:hypothetical protein AXY22_RS10240 [Acinetobacter baumannii]|nr:hypothetical protein [Acinetobacter baumannii]EHU3339306.1 hypothetical protein [Acinetobacter baumannii]EIB7146913.1 hypothetical protein [Acinetobacter baumannii]EIB7151398.1 hypothetical protein [Acinetobacter baumannii]EIB7164484.1 hypothetical protein [Acinetobacter baumannii]
MSTAEGNINSTNTAVGGLSTRMATAEGKITNQSDSIASLQNSVTSINGTLANKADSSAVNNLTSRVETAEGKISSQSGQITSLSNSLDLTNSNLNDVNVLARLLSLGKPLREDPTFKTTSSGGLSAYNFPAGTSWIKQAKSTDNPTGSTHEMLIKATQALGGGWYPTAPTLVLTANKTFLIKQIIKMPVGTRLLPVGNTTGTGGYIRILGNDLGTGKFETYYSVVQGGSDLSSSIQGHFRVIAGTNPPVPTVDSPVFVILASYEVFDVTAVNDTIPKAYSDAIAANANAINTISNAVSQQGNTIASHSNSITQLNNSITSINGALSQKADAAALNSLSNRVTTAEGNITSQGNSITSLTNSLAVSGKAGTNLLIKSNQVGTYDGVSYPHHTYKLGEDWEIGATYTLIWCAEHKRGTGDTNSSLAVYAGGGSQHLQAVVNTNGKVVSKVTFVKNSAVASGPIIHFYMLNRPTADKGSVGTVYWAVLVKGDVLTTDAWIPSPYDYIPDSNANASAIANLTNTVSQQGNTITSNSSSITSLTNQIGNTKSYSLVTFRNGSAVGMPKAAGVYTGNNTRLYGFGRGLNLIVFKNGDVESCTQYDTYGDIVSACNAIYAAIKALSSGTYFAIVGTDNVGSVGNSNPNTDLRALLLACGSGDTYFKSWNWNALPLFVGRKDLDAGNGILGMFDSTIPNQWIEYPLTFVNGVPVGLGDSRTLTSQLDANASAISSLTNTVTQQGKDIASHSSSITSLNNSITNINSTLATKADSSALTNLASRVTATEGAITSHGSSITSLNASVNGLLKDVSVSDTRSTNQPPSWYWSNYPLRIVREFKQASVLGLTGMGTYVSLETYVYWTDASGGPIIQIARGTDSKLTAERRSASTAAWSTWTQDIKAISDGLANKAEASALSSLDSKVSVIDGKVSTQASSITTLQTTVGGNTASIQSQQQSIDGLKARATLKLQSGNLVGGVGIENDSKTVDFIIQANKFAIGAPSTVSGSVTPKYAFVYQSTATTLPNGTVIPAGLYLDSASISYINANKIYADSLSAISANLGTFTSLADQSKPNGARTVISGERIEVYDENNVMRVRIGRW